MSNSIKEFQNAIRNAAEQGGHVVPCGSQSKLRSIGDATTISTTNYAGIVDHQASDFTIAARAGTLVCDLRDTLSQAGQHLPFDPTFVDRNATIGGLVAAGLNGPCRLRYGGIRDFIIGCQFLDGNANVIRGGGRVVKNAAGFDIPKFMVGSAGRFGLLLEVTFKVFPKPRYYQSVRFATPNLAASIELSQTLNATLDFEAIEIVDSTTVLARFSGEDTSVIDATQKEIHSATSLDFETLTDDTEQATWSDLANFRSLADSDLLVKIPMTPRTIAGFDQQTNNTVRYSTAGNVAFVKLRAMDELPALESTIAHLGLAGQMIVGPRDPFLLGTNPGISYLQRIKKAIDPNDVFGSLASTSGVTS